MSRRLCLNQGSLKCPKNGWIEDQLSSVNKNILEFLLVFSVILRPIDLLEICKEQ